MALKGGALCVHSLGAHRDAWSRTVLNTGGVCQGFSANGEVGQMTLHPDPVVVSHLQILMGRTTMQQHCFLVMAAIQSLEWVSW